MVAIDTVPQKRKEKHMPASSIESEMNAGRSPGCQSLALGLPESNQILPGGEVMLRIAPLRQAMKRKYYRRITHLTAWREEMRTD
jgi:hypothetical protein